MGSGRKPHLDRAVLLQTTPCGELQANPQSSCEETEAWRSSIRFSDFISATSPQYFVGRAWLPVVFSKAFQGFHLSDVRVKDCWAKHGFVGEKPSDHTGQVLLL